MNRPDLPNVVLLAGAMILAAVLVGYFALVQPALPQAWRKPGSPPLYVAGLLGVGLLSTGFAFVIVKRMGNAESPPAWFVAHVLGTSAGAVLVFIHSAGFLRRPPALLLLALLAIVVVGIWGRVHEARNMARTFATKQRSFFPAGDKARMRTIIARKRDILARLDPAAEEALFSLTPRHWLARPALALSYARLVHEERRLIGTRASVGATQAWWRRLHVALAYLFLLGTLIHIVTVTFFAGYVADYGDVHWWHVTAW